jgi:hypothetical protein
MRPNITIKYVTTNSAFIQSSGVNSANWLNNFMISDFMLRWVQVLGLLALIATVICYVWLALLQNAANSINQKALMSSRAAWINIHDLKTRLLDGKLIGDFIIENHSESPALHIEIKWGLQVEDEPISWQTYKGHQDSTLMSKENRTGSQWIGDDSTAAEYPNILSGNKKLICDVAYSDIFGRYFRTVISFLYDPLIRDYRIRATTIKLPPNF